MSPPADPAWEVTPRELATMLSEGRVMLIDCRTRDEHREAHIEGATLVPLDELPDRAAELADEAARRGVAVIAHCHHGVRSLAAATILREAGADHAKSLAGGIDLWSLEIDAAVPRY